MKNLLKSIVQVFSITILITSCGGTSIEISPEMSSFNAMMKGSHEDVVNAVEKYASDEKLNDNDIVYFGLSNPEVKERIQDCYIVDYEAGVTIRTYEICWKEGKIVSISEKGLKVK